MPFDATPQVKPNPSVSILKDAKRLISKRNNWCKGSEIRLTDDHNYQYCMLGAIYRIAGRYSITAMFAERYLEEAIDSWTGIRSIPQFNDAADTTHDQVMKIYDRAIEIAKDNCS